MRPAIAPAVTVDKLTKKYGSQVVVNKLSFTAQPGRVLGFLGPNGSGKTTTLRMLLGLARPSSGVALIGGRRYTDYEYPASVIGASLDSGSFHPGRSGRNHLRVLAEATGTEPSRVDEVLDMVGLLQDGKRRVKGYSLGMRQRLGLAAALLTDPTVLVLDEPINGLDPEGIRWIRELLRYLATEGKNVIVSSHVLTEVQQTVDDVVIINEGRLVFSGSMADLGRRAGTRVIVDSPDRAQLAAALSAAGLVFSQREGHFVLDESTAAQVGHIAFSAGVELSHLSEPRIALEDVFMSIIAESTQVLPFATAAITAVDDDEEDDPAVATPAESDDPVTRSEDAGVSAERNPVPAHPAEAEPDPMDGEPTVAAEPVSAAAEPPAAQAAPAAKAPENAAEVSTDEK